jgi:hypothetical protein
LRTAVVAAGLLAVAVGVFVWLPQWVADSSAKREEAAPAATAPVEPAKPQLSPEEAAALETQAESLLANLLTQQSRLNAQSVASWGGVQWQRYEELSRTGDDALLADEFTTAVVSYTEATALGDELLVRAAETLDGALAAAAAAVAAGNSELAVAQYDIVLGIDPANAAAQAGRTRALRLPEVLALVQRADAERSRGELQAALGSYREALAIDAGWEPARVAISAINGGLQDAEFERVMSLGFNSLAAEDFTAAMENFRAVLALRPGTRAAEDGLTQAEQGAKLDKIALTEARGLAFERRELWDQAIAQYRAVLATDANLLFAQTGLERASARAGLDAKLVNLIDHPTLLFGDRVLADARMLLEQAAAQTEKGPRLEEQVGKLGRFVELAATPIPVRIESDQLTDVTLYRVGALGVFAAKQVELRPGTYTAIGSRDGYRDVRRTFTVLPGRELPPVTVVCVETI